MKALRKILNNLQKYATTVTLVKNNVNVVTPLLPENRSLEETDLDKETPHSEIGVNTATPQAIDPNECLKEFDDILEEINKDVKKGASLDDIDDVLKDMAQEDTKHLMFEVPKFDLAEISTAFENLKDDVDISNSLISLDDSIVSFSDIANSNEVIEQNDAISISSEDSSPEGCTKYIPTENSGYVEQNINFNLKNTVETKKYIKHSESIECPKLDNMYIGTEKDQGIEKQIKFHVATNEEIVKTDKTKESIKTNSVKGCEQVNDLTIKKFVFMDYSDDLAEISTAFENLKDDDVDITNSLISWDDSIVSFSDTANSNELIEQNDAISISSEDSSPEGCTKYIPTENSGNAEQNIDLNMKNTEEPKKNIEHSESIECAKLDNMYIGAEKDQGIEKQIKFHVAKNEEIDKTNEPTDKTKESIKTNSVEGCEQVNDLTKKDVVFMDDSDDGGYQSSDFEFITEEEAKVDGLLPNFEKKTHKRKSINVNRVKTIEVAEHQFYNAKKSLKRKKIKSKTKSIDKDPDWAPESDTDSISDDAFIPEDMECVSRNNTRSKNNNMPEKSPERNTFRLRQIRIPPKRYNGIPRFINLQINSDSLTSRNITEFNDYVKKSNEERDDPGRNNFRGFSNECRNELATMKMECYRFATESDDLELTQVDNLNANFNIDLPEKVANSVKIVPENKFMQGSYPDSNNMVIKTNEMQDEPDLNNIDTLKSPEKMYIDPGSYHAQRPKENIIPGSSFIQENNPESNNMVIKTNEMQDGLEPINIATLKSSEKNNIDPGRCHSLRPQENTNPETSIQNVPDPNNFKPGPSRMQEIPKLDSFGAGPSCKRNRSDVDEIEKWRMYQMRKRLNRPQFVVDYSYRDNHRIYQGNDLNQLFDPNRAPLPTARSMRLLENKSTVCKNSMLVEYQGVGFDVPLRRDSGSEDDEAKREANECAQKILEMYPGENTRRSRRRRN